MMPSLPGGERLGGADNPVLVNTARTTHQAWGLAPASVTNAASNLPVL